MAEPTAPDPRPFENVTDAQMSTLASYFRMRAENEGWAALQRGHSAADADAYRAWKREQQYREALNQYEYQQGQPARDAARVAVEAARVAALTTSAEAILAGLDL